MSDRIDELELRINALEQRISDVNDAALYDRSQLEERIDALERRIDDETGLDNRLLRHISARLKAIEHRLGHKSIETSEESIKNAIEAIKIRGGE